MPARKKSRTGVHLAKLNQVHPRVRHDDEGAALLATLALIVVMPLARTDVRVCCTGSDPEYNDALPLDDEPEEPEEPEEEYEEEAAAAAGARKRKRKQRARAAETAALPGIRQFFSPAAAPAASQPSSDASGLRSTVTSTDAVRCGAIEPDGRRSANHT